MRTPSGVQRNNRLSKGKGQGGVGRAMLTRVLFSWGYGGSARIPTEPEDLDKQQKKKKKKKTRKKRRDRALCLWWGFAREMKSTLWQKDQ